MKKIYFLGIAFTMFSTCANLAVNAQGVSLNAGGIPPDPSAMLDVSSNTKGALIPRMTTAERNVIVNPANGLFIYNTDCNVVNFNAGTPESPDWATLNSSNALTAGLSITANPIGAICAGTSITFTATPNQNNLSPSYQWKLNGNNAGGDSATYITTGLNNGDVVSCLLTSNVNCVTGSPANSNAITISVNTVPNITGTTPAAFCAGSAVTLSASANLGTINWYSDSTGGSSLSSGASFTVSGLTATTTYYVDATANGCTSPTRTAVTATYYPAPPGEPGAITGPANVGADSATTYSISPLPNTVNYIWTTTLLNLVYGQATTSINVTWAGYAGVGGVISVAAGNPCGVSPAQTMAVTVGQIFSYTGGQQSFTVPAGASNVTVAVYGAQGGSQYNNGALGGSATGSLSVTPGEILYVFTGGQNGYNGGGQGLNSCNGGGESDVRTGGTSIANWVIVAGGGGGGGNNGGNAVNSATGTGGGGAQCGNGVGGGGGGYYIGGSGSEGGAGTCTGGGGAGNSGGGWGGGAGGGGLTGGGAGGNTGGYGNAGSAGGQGQGGNYGSNGGCGSGGGSSVGGGGGGYYGGGGAAICDCAGGSGGGGSSWAAASMTNTNFSGGVQTGNGLVLISWY